MDFSESNEQSIYVLIDATESLEVLARFAMVTLEKYQGINGLGQWDECQNGTGVQFNRFIMYIYQVSFIALLP